ncbi:MAG: DUF488 domain-containing protein [Pseudomonadales bacterium]|nr:DUF488 domain-containing protein [Pseudomonadales bacterium]
MSLFSIGYATKPLTTLLDQLHSHEIGAVADIRSVPYSAAFKEYHREALQAALRKAQIHYVYMGRELGPRSENDDHYDESGQVQFLRLMQSVDFLEGIHRLQTGLSKNMNIAMLCAEKDPAICHRSLLVGHYLKRHCDIEVQHIRHTGELETQTDLEIRLIELQNLQADLVTDSSELAQIAYERQLQQRAYRRPQQDS